MGVVHLCVQVWCVLIFFVTRFCFCFFFFCVCGFSDQTNGSRSPILPPGPSAEFSFFFFPCRNFGRSTLCLCACVCVCVAMVSPCVCVCVCVTSRRTPHFFFSSSFSSER